MKAINAIIIVLVAALAFSTYLLVARLLPKADSGRPSSTTVSSSKQEAPAPGLVAVQQPRPEINSTAAPSPQTPMTGHEQQAAQNQPAPAPPVKEEPKLRPVRDIKVVMYMTDW
jgi:hypothetical protein